jgi:hypothetical protein
MVGYIKINLLGIILLLCPFFSLGQISPFYTQSGTQDQVAFSGIYYNGFLYASYTTGASYYAAGPNPTQELLKLNNSGLVTQRFKIDTLFSPGSLPFINQIQEKNDTLHLLVNLIGKAVSKPYIVKTDSVFSFYQIDSLDFSNQFAKLFIQNFYFNDNYIVYYGYNDTINSQGTFWQLDGVGIVVNNALADTLVLYYPKMYFTGIHITNSGYMAQDISSSKVVYFTQSGTVERIKSYCVGGMFAEGSQVADSLFFIFGTWCGGSYRAGFAVYSDSVLIHLNDSVPFFKPDMQISYHNFQYVSNDNIYIGITHNWPSIIDLFPIPQWFSITKTDINGTTIWQKTFGGDVNHILYALVQGPDSSIFLFTTRYDWTIQNNERDLYIYKIDKNGSMLSTPEHGSLQAIEAVVYPNPFTNQIEVKILNEDLRQANVVLTDISGRTVLQKNLEMGLTKEHTLNTQHLPAGVYVLTLADAQGNVLQRQKVVKQ